MNKSLKKSPLVGLAVLLAASLAFVVPSIATAEDQGQNRDQSRGQSQSREDGNQAPQVRLGNPSKTISSDSDQADYDRQDGGIAGVSVLGSRVFEAKAANAAAPKAPAVVNPNLIKHSGNAMPVTHIYAIFWGGNITSAYSSAVEGFLNSISNSSYNRITDQYFTSPMRNSMSFVRSYADASTPPSSAPTTASILAEVNKVVTKSAIDASGLYMVFTNNYPTRANYCAWHGAGSVSGSPVFTVAYQPFVGNTSGCAASYMTGWTPSDTSTRTAANSVESLANVASHEIYETVTDPLLNAWYDSTGAEIGDKCAWYFGSTKIGTYSVQPEWDNASKSCLRP